ncbi:SDR family oxidoreductase [Thalassococcus sp. S3]|uniref:SDR family oxidoreductase n=1 Tax=Thalassococcus sp. S3 TaxID=2017482 RepID=UPI00102471EB|nr:SDR family oxidoreductase [Thalassococcus sp. S3]QBF31279.1 NAD(P)-dependent oxidoreductase [Thalassococcus sp. S3]
MSRPVMLITGASAGIGAATARLASPDYDLALNYRSDRDGAAAAARLAEAEGARCVLCPGDVSRAEDRAVIYDALEHAFGRIDVLVNNAGIVDQSAKLTDMTEDRLTRMFNINVIGAMLMAKEAVIRMQAQGDGGAIINISSAAARLGSGNQYVDYAASKAAIDTFTKGLSDEVAADNIRVTSVRPGIIDTAIHAKGGEPDRADRLAPMVPMRRKGTAEEVAEAILWLASQKASYVTGTTLDVTGGR